MLFRRRISLAEALNVFPGEREEFHLALEIVQWSITLHSLRSNNSHDAVASRQFTFSSMRVKRNAFLLHYSVVGTQRKLESPSTKGRIPCPTRVPPGRIRAGPGPARMRLPKYGEDRSIWRRCVRFPTRPLPFRSDIAAARFEYAESAKTRNTPHRLADHRSDHRVCRKAQ